MIIHKRKTIIRMRSDTLDNQAVNGKAMHGRSEADGLGSCDSPEADLILMNYTCANVCSQGKSRSVAFQNGMKKSKVEFRTCCWYRNGAIALFGEQVVLETLGSATRTKCKHENVGFEQGCTGWEGLRREEIRDERRRGRRKKCWMHTKMAQ